MKAHIEKWGNSLALRIPKAAARKVGLTQGLEVELVAGKGQLEIRLREVKTYSLSQLLKGMNRKKIHPEVDWGPPVGREVW